MSDFRIHEDRSPSSEHYPFLIDVQSDFLSALDTRLVIPLVPSAVMGNRVICNLNPSVKVEGRDFVVLTQQMAAVPKTMLGSSIERVEVSRTDILGSIDFLVTGF